MANEDFVKAHSVPEDTVCLCGNAECAGLTASFSLLGDARKRFVELPRHLEKGSCKQREAYLRHVLPKTQKDPPSDSSNYIALFHFHPAVLWDSFSQHPGKHQIPKTISCGHAVELHMILSEKDKVADHNGMPAFIFSPTYPLELAKKDLEALDADTKIQDCDSIDSTQAVDRAEQQPTTIENIPSHVNVEEDTASDVSSDVSSMVDDVLIVDEARDAMTLTTLVAAAITCQNFIRRCHAVHVLQQRKRERNALLTLQSSTRMHLVRKQLGQQHTAGTTIQTQWRTHEARKSFVQLATSTLLLQRVIRGHMVRYAIRHKIPNDAAVTIQSCWRCYWTRRDYLLYLGDVVLMQSLVRKQAAIEEVKFKRVALLMVQTNARRWMAERQFRNLRESSVVIQTKWRQHVAYHSYCQQPCSAIQIQRVVRGQLARRYVQARMTSATHIQQAWRRNWTQIQHNRTRNEAAKQIQALTRGYTCRIKMGWMLSYARMKVAEQERCKMYEEMLEDACTTWACSIEMLEGGVHEISRAERLVVGASMADQALANALRSIAQDEFVSDDYNDIVATPENGPAKGEMEQDLPMDPVLKTLLNADIKMADRFNDMSGSGISEIGPELAAFRQELELQLREVKGTGNALVRSLPTMEMKKTEKATKHAWDELQATVQRMWQGAQSSTLGKGSIPGTISVGLKTKKDKEGAKPRQVEMLVPFRDSKERPATTRSDQVSPLSSPKGGTASMKTATESPPETKTGPQGSPTTPVRTPDRRRDLPVDMGMPSLAAVSSPESVITEEGDEMLSPPRSSSKCDLVRQSSGYGWKDGMPLSPSSRRSVFGRQSSGGDLVLSRDLSADDCIAIMTQGGSQKHGLEFFEYLSQSLLTKNAPPQSPEWPSLSRSPSTSSSRSHDVDDRWLLESNYHAAATHQALVWNAYLGLLTKISSAVKEIELERCVKLSSSLLVAVPLERRVLLEMREVHEEVTEELLAIHHDKQYLSESIDETIGCHAQLLLQRDCDHKSSVLNRSKSLAPDLSHPTESLEPETTYGITHHAMVVERSVGLRSWKMTLVVATADRYMHLFDASFIPDIAVGSSPNEAFDKLLPNDDFYNRQIEPRKEKLLKNLSPVSVVNLRKCRILTMDANTVEVTEKYTGVFRDTATRKFFLRGKIEDLKRWKHFLTRKSS